MFREEHTLSIGFILQSDGRWNRFGEYGCLYTSLSRDGARAEYLKTVMEHAALDPTEDAERDLTTLDVDVQPVFDLSDRETRRELDLSLEDITGDSDESIELCRSIADWVRSQGYNAIFSPSAAMRSEKNLNIYHDVRPADLRVEIADVREPLNY